MARRSAEEAPTAVVRRIAGGLLGGVECDGLNDDSDTRERCVHRHGFLERLVIIRLALDAACLKDSRLYRGYLKTPGHTIQPMFTWH